jgi:hypothetical protein
MKIKIILFEQKMTVQEAQMYEIEMTILRWT